MILVDIQVPAIDKVYDFELEETAKVEGLLKDIAALIAGQDQLQGSNPGDLFLYAVRQEAILRRQETLEHQGVRSGDRLILM